MGLMYNWAPCCPDLQLQYFCAYDVFSFDVGFALEFVVEFNSLALSLSV